MADALCGPSNPLQQLKQQTQFDRTLQQDRLASRHQPGQGFRSRDPNVGLLDPEFEAFQAGHPIPDLPQFQQRRPDFAAPSQGPSWAGDFQRMHISHPPPPSFHQSPVVQSKPATPNWAQGFQEHIGQNAPRTQLSSHSPQAFQHMARYGMNSFQSNFSQPAFALETISKGKAPMVEQFDEAAFERAFDQASLDMVPETATATEEMERTAYETGASTGNVDLDYDTLMESINGQATSATNQTRLQPEIDAQALEDAVRMNPFEPLGDDLVMEQVSNAEQQEQLDPKPNDDDALAATARELLEKVQHNQSDKFKNSQFLNLMRKLRDREMKVEGDHMVETVRAPLKSPPSPPLDSAYASGPVTPPPPAANIPLTRTRSRPFPEFDTHLEPGDHAFDHWESPYR